MSDEEEFKSARAVLLVRIKSTEFVPSSIEREFDSVRAYFDVIETFKGQRGALHYLKAEKTVCELPMIAGDYYLAYSRGEEYEVLNICTRSRWINLTRDKALLDEYSKRHK